MTISIVHEEIFAFRIAQPSMDRAAFKAKAELAPSQPGISPGPRCGAAPARQYSGSCYALITFRLGYTVCGPQSGSHKSRFFVCLEASSGSVYYSMTAGTSRPETCPSTNTCLLYTS